MTRLVPRHLAIGIRTRVTAWYTLVFALLLVLLGGALYAAVDQSVTGGFDAALELRAEQIASGITTSSAQSGLTVKDVTGGLPGLNSPAADGQSSGASSDPAEANPLGGSGGVPPDVTFGTLVRVLDVHGQTVYQSPSFRAITAPPSSVTAALKGSAWRATLSARDGQAVRLYSAPVSQGGAVFGVIQVGEPLSTVTVTLDSLQHSLLFVVPCVLLLGAVGSYWLAGRAFRPVHLLTHTARQLGARDLHRKLPVPGARDEVHELAVTLNEMLGRLDDAFAVQRRFVADASHELRSPVAAIRSMTDVALAGSTSHEDCLDVMRRVNNQAERLGVLIGDLLLLARTDEGQPAIDLAPVRLDLLVAEVAVVEEAHAQEKGIAINFKTDGPLMVLGDEARLVQALLNLLDNAIDFTGENGKVEVTVDAHQAQGIVTIRDSGVGIGAEHLPHIFRRFYRADPARSRYMGGSGLGLAIVDWVIRAHNGTIAVESALGHGTTFVIALPLAS